MKKLKVNGVRSNSYTVEERFGRHHIVLSLTQKVSGSAPMKIAGLILSLYDAYKGPEVEIIVDLEHATITTTQMDFVILHASHLNTAIPNLCISIKPPKEFQ